MQIQEMASGDPQLTLLTGHILVENQQIPLAIRFYESILGKGGYRNNVHVLTCISRAYYILAKTAKDSVAMKSARKFIQKAIYSEPENKSLLFNLALIDQQMATILNEQTLENRSIPALKEAHKNLILSEK
jgi:RNA polymerase-associated protein CTR9